MRSFKLSSQNAVLRFHDIPGCGIPLLFVHGLGCASSFDYPRVVADPALSQRRVILVDLLGSGFSDRPDSFGYLVEDHARSLVELIQCLETKVDLFGHSMGGAVAIVAASITPREVCRLILAEPNLDAGGGILSRTIAAYQESEYVSHGHAATSREGNSVWAGSAAISDPRAMHRAATSLVKGGLPAWRELLLELRMPRSVILGERSLPHPDVDSLSRAGIQVSIVPNAGHFMMWDNAAGLAIAIHAALSTVHSDDR